MEFKEYLVSLQNRNGKIIKRIYYLVLALTAVAFVLWISPFESQHFDPEAAFTILFILSTSFSQLYRILLDEAEYSPALALAYGYVENFLEPAITQLISEEKNSLIHIYKPQNIEELFEKNIERVRGKIRAKNYVLTDIVLDQKYARARDIILIEKEKGKQSYFDFPSTLKSLIPYIDYKLVSKKNESIDELKIELGKKLVTKFFLKIDDLVIRKGLSDSVKICDNQLNFDL